MKLRVYRSTISAAWPLARQDALLDARLPGWRDLPNFLDEPSARERRARQSASLVDRGTMLLGTTRRTTHTIAVASLPCFAWAGRDFEAAVADLAACNALLHALDLDRTFSAADLPGALTAFAEARERARHEALQQAGAVVSAEKRRAVTDLGVERIEHLWPLPSAEWPTFILRLVASETVAPRSYNTLVDRLGGREKKQAEHARRVSRRKRADVQKRKEAQDE